MPHETIKRLKEELKDAEKALEVKNGLVPRYNFCFDYILSTFL